MACLDLEPKYFKDGVNKATVEQVAQMYSPPQKVQPTGLDAGRVSKATRAMGSRALERVVDRNFDGQTRLSERVGEGERP